MELLWKCRYCRHEQFIQLEDLVTQKIDGIFSVAYYNCSDCKAPVWVSFTTLSMEKQLRKLTQYSQDHPKFPYLFNKALKKARGVNARGEPLWHVQM